MCSCQFAANRKRALQGSTNHTLSLWGGGRGSGDGLREMKAEGRGEIWEGQSNKYDYSILYLSRLRGSVRWWRGLMELKGDEEEGLRGEGIARNPETLVFRPRVASLSRLFF